jgi:TPR repeat protein
MMNRLLAMLFCLVYLGAEVNNFDSLKIDSYQRNCNNNIAEGCFNVGIAYFLGDGFKKNDAKAKEYLQIAYGLEPKNPTFTATLARLYYYEYKTKNSNSLNDALNLLNEACNKAESGSCSMLGEIYEFGDDNIKIDLSKAASYYKKSCNLNNIKSCDKLRSLKNK